MVSMYTAYMVMIKVKLTKKRLAMTTRSNADVPRATRLSFCTPYAIAAPREITA